MTLTPHDKIVLSIFTVLFIVIFFLGRITKSDPEIIHKPKTEQFIKTIDSLKTINEARQDTILIEKLKAYYQSYRFDSLSLVLKSNHKTTANGIKNIQNFNTDSRNRFRDSVKRADGIK